MSVLIIDQDQVRRLLPMWTVPKRLRLFFRFDRRLLAELPRLAWQTVLEVYRAVLDRDDVVPGMIAAIHTFGERVHWHPHIHALVTDGAFGERDNHPASGDRHRALREALPARDMASTRVEGPSSTAASSATVSPQIVFMVRFRYDGPARFHCPDGNSRQADGAAPI